MGVRAIWSGVLSFGLVSIPCKVYAATEARALEFHNLCPTCHTPLKYRRWCPSCEQEVAWTDLKKGYKIAKEQWVILEKADLERVRLPTTKAIEISQFVDATRVDPIYFQKTYYVAPQEAGIKAYSLFVEALRVAGKAAIGKFVLRNKEQVVLLRPFKRGLAMHVLFYQSEIRDIEQLEELKRLVVVSEDELKLARALIEGLTRKEFDPTAFTDAYTEALKQLIQAKAAGKSYEVRPEKVAVEAKTLMEALRASVEKVKKKKVKAKS
jgi:DNA end-binding protein Ku